MKYIIFYEYIRGTVNMYLISLFHILLKMGFKIRVIHKRTWRRLLLERIQQNTRCVFARKSETCTEQTGGSDRVLKTEVSLREVPPALEHPCVSHFKTGRADPTVHPERQPVIYPFRYAMGCGMNEIIYF